MLPKYHEVPQNEYNADGQMRNSTTAPPPGAALLVDPASHPLINGSGQQQDVMVSGTTAPMIIQSESRNAYVSHIVIASIVALLWLPHWLSRTGFGE